MTTPIAEVLGFLDIASKKSFFNENTIGSRRVACNKFFEILDEDQRTAEYVRDNIGVIKVRFTNRYTDVLGSTVEQYAKRVQLVLNDFFSWKADRPAWERDVATRQSGRTTGADGEKRARAEKQRPAAATPPPSQDETDARTVNVPLPSGFEVQVRVPRDLSVTDLKRVLWALLPYASDWDPDVSPRQTFPQLESRTDLGA